VLAVLVEVQREKEAVLSRYPQPLVLAVLWKGQKEKVAA